MPDEGSLFQDLLDSFSGLSGDEMASLMDSFQATFDNAVQSVSGYQPAWDNLIVDDGAGHQMTFAQAMLASPEEAMQAANVYNASPAGQANPIDVSGYTPPDLPNGGEDPNASVNPTSPLGNGQEATPGQEASGGTGGGGGATVGTGGRTGATSAGTTNSAGSRPLFPDTPGLSWLTPNMLTGAAATGTGALGLAALIQSLARGDKTSTVNVTHNVPPPSADETAARQAATGLLNQTSQYAFGQNGQGGVAGRLGARAPYEDQAYLNSIQGTQGQANQLGSMLWGQPTQGPMNWAQAPQTGGYPPQQGYPQGPPGQTPLLGAPSAPQPPSMTSGYGTPYGQPGAMLAPTLPPPQSYATNFDSGGGGPTAWDLSRRQTETIGAALQGGPQAGAVMDPNGRGYSVTNPSPINPGAGGGTYSTIGGGPMQAPGMGGQQGLIPQLGQNASGILGTQAGLLNSYANMAQGLTQGNLPLTPELSRLVEQAYQPQLGDIATQAIESARQRGFAGGANLLNTGPGGAIAGPALAALQGQMANSKLNLATQIPQLASQAIGTYSTPGALNLQGISNLTGLNQNVLNMLGGYGQQGVNNQIGLANVGTGIAGAQGNLANQYQAGRLGQAGTSTATTTPTSLMDAFAPLGGLLGGLGSLATSYAAMNNPYTGTTGTR